MEIVKANGAREPFDVQKLRHSLVNAGASDENAEKVINHIEAELHEGMSTAEIYRHAFNVLNELNTPIAHSYSLRRAIMHLGPAGFRFEDLVAEILKEQGYEVMPRQIVMGGCVAHEVDVVAWTREKLVMVEAKYHNELGTKSDLKVALYVKARIDDLKQNTFDYGLPAQVGGTHRKLDEGWLVTNTKFSSTAIQYGKCTGLTMIGWNYPEEGNLHDMIGGNQRLLDLIFKDYKPQ